MSLLINIQCLWQIKIVFDNVQKYTGGKFVNADYLPDLQ